MPAAGDAPVPPTPDIQLRIDDALDDTGQVIQESPLGRFSSDAARFDHTIAPFLEDEPVRYVEFVIWISC